MFVQAPAFLNAWPRHRPHYEGLGSAPAAIELRDQDDTHTARVRGRCGLRSKATGTYNLEPVCPSAAYVKLIIAREPDPGPRSFNLK